MIATSTRKLTSLTRRIAMCMAQDKVQITGKSNVVQNALDKLPKNQFMQEGLAQQKEEFSRFIEQKNELARNNIELNFINQDGRRPLIISDKTPLQWPIYDLTAGLGWTALFYQTWMGSFSYAVMGVTAIAAIVRNFSFNPVSREAAFRFFRDTAPEIDEVWFNENTNEYEIQVWKSSFPEQIKVPKDQFKFAVGPNCHKWYSTSLKSFGLHRILTEDPNPGIWCTINGQPHWLNSNAKINNNLLKTLI